MSGSKLRALYTSPDFKIDGGKMVSIEGPMTSVLHILQDKKWNPSQIVMIGQNGAKVAADDLKSVRMHVVAVHEVDGDVEQTRSSIDPPLLKAFKQDGYDYVHLLTGLDRGVCLGVFGSDFAVNPHAEAILKSLTEMFFTKLGHYRFGKTVTNTLLLVGNEGERVTAGLVDGRIKSFGYLSNTFAPGVQMRHAVVGSSMFLVATCDGKQVCGATSDTIVNYLMSTKPDRVLTWSFVQLGHDIEDIAVVDGSANVVIFTLKDGDYRLMPMRVRFEYGRMELIPTIADGVSVTDLNGEFFPSIVRVTKDGNLILADRSQGFIRVCFECRENFGFKLATTIQNTLQNTLAA